MIDIFSKAMVLEAVRRLRIGCIECCLIPSNGSVCTQQRSTVMRPITILLVYSWERAARPFEVWASSNPSAMLNPSPSLLFLDN